MKLLFVVDGRSPIALNWIRYFVEDNHEVHLVSSYPCQPELKLASLTVIPTAFGGLAGAERQQAGGQSGRSLLRKLIPVQARTVLRQWLGPLTLTRAARQLRAVMDDLQPDLAHAMRIPFEGMLLSQAALSSGERPPPPTLASVWGNDFTLHAKTSPRMAFLTRLTLQNITALHTDCQRDQKLAHQWGFGANKPAIILPGNGGIDMDLFLPPHSQERQPIVINPRGIRAYVRNDTFFSAIPLVLAKQPKVHFICPNMAGETQAKKWVNQYAIAASIELLPRQKRLQMAKHFQKAQVVVSLTEHDGTPNTLLEAMACGCYPVVGDIESIREWLSPGVNGSLVSPGDATALAGAILQALDSPALRQSAAKQNIQSIHQRAEYSQCMAKAENFYQEVLTIQRRSQ